VLDADYLIRAKSVIETAHAFIDIVQYEIFPGEGVDLLRGAVKDAAARGVKCRVFLDESIDDNTNAIKEFKEAGCQATLDTSAKTTHAKIVLSEQAFVVGSHNWSTASVLYNHETSLLVRHEGCRASMKAYIDKLWAAPKTSATTKLASDTTCAMYSDTGYGPAIKPALQAAKKEILIITYGVNFDFDRYPKDDPQVSLKLLADKAKAGVKVRFVLENSGFDPELTKLNQAAADWLTSQNIEVRFDDAKTVTHAKIFIADGTVVAGTNNWGYGGFMLNHEAGVRSTDATVVAAFRAYFEKQWAAGKAW